MWFERFIPQLLSCCFLIGVLTACAPDAERSQETPPSGPNIDVITGLMDAFNAHDPEKMREYWRQDVEWIEIAGDQASVITSDADTLYRELVVYFETYPSVRSSLANISRNGAFISAIETAVWEDDGERKSQSSLVVYELAGEKVRRFWYFPTQ